VNIIEVNNLSKDFGEVKAVNDVSFSVEKGEIFGFLGPDGAGKTTLYRMLATLIVPDKGNASVLGMDVVKDYKKIRQKIGYMPGRFSLYPDLSVEENLKFYATIFGTTIEENYNLVKDIYVQLEPFKRRRAGKLSGGMKQKLALCCALIHKPDVIFLDEPTTGVDPVSRNEFWDMLADLKRQSITILVSTPYMDEAIRCDRIALMQKGKTLSIDTPVNILNRFSREIFAIKSGDNYKLLTTLEKYPQVHSVNIFGEFIHYTDSRSIFEINDVQAYLKSNDIDVVSISKVEPTIEDCFMELMKDGANE